MERVVLFADLCCGMGGFHEAISRSHSSLRIKPVCLTACDNNPHAKKSYLDNFNACKWFDDLCSKEAEEIALSIRGELDYLFCGFPCQPFSQMGKKQGMKDERSSVMGAMLNFIRLSRPKVAIIENVPHFLKSNAWPIFHKQLSLIEYDYKIVKLRACDYGDPTLRTRLFIIAIDLYRDRYRLPATNKLRDQHKQMLPYLILNTSTMYHQDSPTLPERLGFELCDKNNVPRQYAKTIRCGGRRSKFDDRRSWDCYLRDGKPYYLTVEDCKKIMGFSDNYKLNVSKTQAYKLLGNTVSVSTVKELIARTLPFLR